jgi:hypothetical protein
MLHCNMSEDVIPPPPESRVFCAPQHNSKASVTEPSRAAQRLMLPRRGESFLAGQIALCHYRPGS